MATSNTSRRPGKLFDMFAQAPSPSKDLHQLQVVDGVVIWRHWPISLRKARQTNPDERRVPLNEFAGSSQLRSEIRRIFGTNVDERLRNMEEGQCPGIDGFSSLPRRCLLSILKLLDLQSLCMLSACNRFLHKACGDDDVWKGIYRYHHGRTNVDDLETLAAEISWRAVFYTDQQVLQDFLQMIRIRDQSARQRKTSRSRLGSNSAFLPSGTK